MIVNSLNTSKMNISRGKGIFYHVGGKFNRLLGMFKAKWGYIFVFLRSVF